jgi:hypothetical protein
MIAVANGDNRPVAGTAVSPLSRAHVRSGTQWVKPFSLTGAALGSSTGCGQVNAVSIKREDWTPSLARKTNRASWRNR